MKYPIGVQAFDKVITGDYIYVDKTDLVYSLVKGGSIYFLSRPRRFGKSLLVSTLKSYFLGRQELFKGLKIDTLEKEWKAYPVFHVDFNSDNFTKIGTLEATLEDYVETWEKKYAVTPNERLSIGRRFAKVLEAAHEQTGLPCVVLIDEYDKPLLDVMATNHMVETAMGPMTLEENNREVLKGFYSTFKLADEHLQFVFLTGVTKFSQLSVFSGFNQPEDISMAPEYETLCGITDEEIDHYFPERIAEMAERQRCSYDEMRELLRKQYDGYHFGEEAVGVYNPFSLLNALKSMRIKNFWFATGTPSYLVRLLEHYDENINELTGRYFSEDKFEDYRADSQEPLPMIYQSGYLTIKDYDCHKRTFLLDFPNNEVKDGFVTILANRYFESDEETGSWVRDLVTTLEQSDLERFRTLFTSFLASIPYTARRKENERERERYFSYTLYLIFRIASCYVTYIEKEQSYGRLDCCIETEADVFIFEFKLDGSAAEALRQIEERGYAAEFAASGKRIHKIGVSVSSETATVEDWGVEEQVTSIK